MQTKHPTATVCSGINFNRRGLQALLEAVMSGRVRTVHVAHRDRLCRFAYDLVRFILEHSGAQLIVESSDVDPTPEGELTDGIITVFGARLYGAPGRGGGRKRSREAAEAGGRETHSGVSQPPDTAPDNTRTAPGAPGMVRRRPLGLQPHRGRRAERGVPSIRDVLQVRDARCSQRPLEGVNLRNGAEQCQSGSHHGVSIQLGQGNEETIRSEVPQCSQFDRIHPAGRCTV